MNGLTEQMFAAQRGFYERQIGNVASEGANAMMTAEKLAQENIELKKELDALKGSNVTQISGEAA